MIDPSSSGKQFPTGGYERCGERHSAVDDPAISEVGQAITASPCILQWETVSHWRILRWPQEKAAHFLTKERTGSVKEANQWVKSFPLEDAGVEPTGRLRDDV